jgi:hypothetical protein
MVFERDLGFDPYGFGWGDPSPDSGGAFSGPVPMPIVPAWWLSGASGGVGAAELRAVIEALGGAAPRIDAGALLPFLRDVPQPTDAGTLLPFLDDQRQPPIGSGPPRMDASALLPFLRDLAQPPLGGSASTQGGGSIGDPLSGWLAALGLDDASAIQASTAGTGGAIESGGAPDADFAALPYQVAAAAGRRRALPQPPSPATAMGRVDQPIAPSPLPADPTGKPTMPPVPVAPAGMSAQQRGRSMVTDYYLDGQLIGTGFGSRARRNNNPGALIYSSDQRAQADGALGRDSSGSAIFPSYAAGVDAQRRNLLSGDYPGLTLNDAIELHTKESDPKKLEQYKMTVRQELERHAERSAGNIVDMSKVKVKDLDAGQFEALRAGMEQAEGSKARQPQLGGEPGGHFVWRGKPW